MELEQSRKRSPRGLIVLLVLIVSRHSELEMGITAYSHQAADTSANYLEYLIWLPESCGTPFCHRENFPGGEWAQVVSYMFKLRKRLCELILMINSTAIITHILTSWVIVRKMGKIGDTAFSPCQ